jgi:adenylate cyclase
VVIAGTIGGGGKLEFTLIGDTLNVAARVEQLTKPPPTRSFSPARPSTLSGLDRWGSPSADPVP